MKRKISLVVVLAMSLSLVACSFTPTCKASDCDETEIYKEDYCKYHYYESIGQDILDEGKEVLKDWINNY